MFDNLSDKLERAFKVLKGQGQITEINVAETVKEIRRALVDADVNYKTAKEFTNTIKERALGQNVLSAISPGQLMIKITNEELTKLMGSENEELDVTGNPSIILMAGLQGSGKTTHSGKLAKYLTETKKKKVLLVACDVYRPAAIDQLHVLGDQLGIEVYSNKEEKNPVRIAEAAIAHAKTGGFNAIIVDTAGRLAVDEKMMNEITEIKRAINPQEILFVVDAMTGQDAVNTAKTFNEKLDFTGVILTKLDGDTRGGAAISIKAVVSKPIKFIGTGEKMEALDVFHPSRMADRILGMGDVVSLVEKATQDIDQEKIKKTEEDLKKGLFTLDSYLDQLRQMKKMGGMEGIMSLLPGVSKMKSQMEKSSIDESMLTENEAIILSMTKLEKENPKIISGSRRKRISNGSGVDVSKINKLIKQFRTMSDMMKKMSQGKKIPSGVMPDEILNQIK
jgi:signal recognition particle subunit SRP54